MKFTYHIKKHDTVKTFLKCQSFSKRTLSAIKRNGALLLNDQPVTVRKEMNQGDILVAKLPVELPSTNLNPFNKTLEIIYEDDYLIIVNKLAHQNSAPSKEHPHESLVEQVYHYLMEQGHSTVPHIVTRLDRNTTGLVIFAKHGHIHHLMSQTYIEKKYICLCYGETPKCGEIEAPIDRVSDSIIKREVASSGKYAKTTYRTLKSKNQYSLCEVRIHTGRTHQIRVYFSYINHPLVGDDLYGGYHSIIDHQCLQCYQVSFKHPLYNKMCTISIDYKQIENKLNMMSDPCCGGV